MSASVDSRNDLPSGTVTLLFADIEGSTRLLHSLRAGFAPVRARLRELVRAAAGAYGGREVDWAGDGVFLAFPRARDAVLAAVELQRALEGEPWPPDGVVRLRIGIHTGEPELGEEGYVGMDVVVAARICAAAHGGQVVVSRATRDFVGDDADLQLSFRPLGSHRLKDVPGAEQLFQLLGPGLQEGFAPLRTLGGAALPALHHRLVGRRQDLTGVLSLLARPDVRLVTITGPGGAGKSRLALEVAALSAVERPVHLVGLAPVSDPELVPATIAHVLGVREGARPLVESIAEALAGTRALLLLDNFEHLAGAARDVVALLDRAPDLEILITSRAPIRLSSEHVVPLQPLSVYDASTLFSELAAARGVVLHEDALPAVREICRRLDGLPLAIELVAARLAVLPPAQLLIALDEGLTLDMEGPVDLPERQRTLRATIDWSYGLLSENQRDLHQALAVFAGGCTLDDARSFSGSTSFLGDLEGLVTGSLLRSDVSDGEARLFMLETVREDALARLESSGKLEELRRRHAERFLELASAAEVELVGADQAAWLDRVERELDNVRAMLDWCLTSGNIEDALRAMSGLDRFWRARGDVSEARRMLARGLARGEDATPEVRADALWTAARQAAAQNDWDAAIPLLEDALALFREQNRPREIVFTLSELASITLHRGGAQQAQGLCEEALAIARGFGDRRAMSGALNILADVARMQGEHERALAYAQEAVELRRSLGDPLLILDSTYHLGVNAFDAGDMDRAEEAFEASLGQAHELGDLLYTGAALCMLGTIALLKDELPSALARLQESLTIYTEVEDDRSAAECLCALGGYAAAAGRPEEAARLWGAADALRGGNPLEYGEPTVQDRFARGLVESLGRERYEELRAEGRRLGREGVLAESGSLVVLQRAE